MARHVILWSFVLKTQCVSGIRFASEIFPMRFRDLGKIVSVIATELLNMSLVHSSSFKGIIGHRNKELMDLVDEEILKMNGVAKRVRR